MPPKKHEKSSADKRSAPFPSYKTWVLGKGGRILKTEPTFVKEIGPFYALEPLQKAAL